MRRRRQLPNSDSSGDAVSLSPKAPLRRVIAIFAPLLRRYRIPLFVLVLVTMLDPLLSGATVWMFRHLIDDVVAVGRTDRFFHFALLFSAASIAVSAVGFVDQILTAWIGENFVRDGRALLLDHVLQLPPDFFDANPLGDLLARLSSDVSSIEEVLVAGVRTAVSSSARVIILAAFVVALNWQLALLSLVVVPLFAITARIFSTRLRQVSRERRRRSGSVGAVAEEILSGVSVVQAHNAQDREAARFDVEARAMVRAELGATRLNAYYRPVIDFLELVGGLLVVWLGTSLIGKGELTLGAMLAFLAYITQLYGPVRGLSKLGASIQHNLAGVDRVIEILDVPAARRRSTARPRYELGGEVEFSDVWFSYPTGGQEALGGISFSLAPGRSVAVVGASGSGKSTLARLLLGWYPPSAGAIYVDGKDITLLDPAMVREAISYLPQEPMLFDGTIAANIAYGRPDASLAAIQEAAEAADAHDFIAASPDGYQSRVGSRGRHLSGGQRQRIALARAFLRDAPILVLDEPLTALDPASQQRIMAPLRRLMAGRATLVISHHLELAEFTDEVVVMDRGRVVERGAHAELMLLPGAYRRLRGQDTEPCPADGHDLNGGACPIGRPVVARLARNGQRIDQSDEFSWVGLALEAAVEAFAARPWDER